MPPVRAFAIASLAPALAIGGAAALGGGWSWLALGWITLAVFALDQIIPKLTPGAEADHPLPAADALSTGLALVHFALLWGVIGVIATDHVAGWSALALYLAASLFFGQVSNSNAHELIHRTDKRLFNLGKLVYISLLFGHHTSAHNKVHHRFAASPDDPNSARPGEGFWSFAPRAWIGSFRKGYEMEQADVERSGGRYRNPYPGYLIGAAAALALTAVAFGPRGVLVHLALAAYAQLQLLLSDYVQHYGLTRRMGENGKLEPIGPAHSWNARHWMSAHMMLNAARHSDHHSHPARAYPELVLHPRAEAPILPSSLPVMASLALFPPLWRRVMDRALTRWQEART